MDNKEFLEVIEKINSNFENEKFIEEFCQVYDISRPDFDVLKNIALSGKKHISSIEKTIQEEGNVEIEKVIEYAEFVSEFLQSNSFVSPLLIRCYPKDKIADFDNKRWASLMKNEALKSIDNEDREILLKMALNFGIFEPDEDADKRLNTLISSINSGIVNEDGLKAYSGFKHLDSSYDAERYDFIRENFENITKIDLDKLQENWEVISKYIDKKTFENVSKYLNISQENGSDVFKTYMELHGKKVPKTHMDKYKKIMEYMQSRTMTSIPKVEGKSQNGYTHEILDFTDIRIIRFGDDENIGCCQKLGSNAETSMINSAIEGSSRVLLIEDEKGEEIAGSFVTHTIGKDGRSYVCFDSIETKASKLGIGVKKFQVLKKKIEKMYKKGKIKGLDLESIREYFEETQGKKSISKKELKSIEISEKIKESVKSAIKDMIEEDEKNRNEQLKNGDITKEEYDKLLMKNGVFTAGNRGFGKIYLGDLTSIEESRKELLPTPEKGLKIYKSMHAISFENVLEKFSMGALNTFGVLGILGTALSLVTAGPVAEFAIMGGIALGSKTAFKKIYKNNHKGIYTDAKKDQKIFYDGRDSRSKEIISREEFRELSKKLKYRENEIFMPTKVSELEDNIKKAVIRTQEVTGREEFGEEDKEKYIVGSKNWYMLFSNEEEEIVINDVVLQGNNCMKEGKNKDSQKDLLNSLKQIVLSAKKNGKMISFDIGDDKINAFCYKYANEVLKEQDSRTEIKESRYMGNGERGKIGELTL